MSVSIYVHKTHRPHTDNLEVVEVEGTSVEACLAHLIRRFPAMEEALFDPKGKLRRNIEIYINAKSAYPDELKKKVSDGDEIHLTVMLAGG
ncbi:MAG: MoaD/ThiS family protein [Deltaproteobacteria bacterium]|nr:MoaD/ThiS family protein [Deltaproteobacteria bacterium]